MDVESISTVMAAGERPKFNDFNIIDPVVLTSGGRGYRVEYQGHHIIPVTVFQNSTFVDALFERNLFDPNSFASNGLAMPWKIGGVLASKSPDRTLVGGALHAGGHMAYNRAVSQIVNRFDFKYRGLS